MDFVQQILAQRVSASDPDKAATRKFVASLTSESQAQAIETRGRTVATLAEQLMKAREDKAPISVIDAFERLLQAASVLED